VANKSLLGPPPAPACPEETAFYLIDRPGSMRYSC
jgi:hypothetical protein